MPIFNYKDVSVKINGSGILAESASIQSQNNLSPFYVIGKGYERTSTVKNVISGPIQSNIGLQYILQTNYSPDFNLVNRIKNSPLSSYLYPATNLEVAGISGVGYLTNFSVNLDGNNPVSVQSNYAIFNEMSGNLGGSSLVGEKYSLDNISGLAHGYTTFVTGPQNYVTGRVFDLNYQCDLNWKPLYILGRKSPLQVNFMDGKETISFTRDVYTGVNFSGQQLTGYFNFSDSSIDFYGLGYLNGATNNLIQLGLTGMIIRQVSTSIDVDDWVKVKVEAERYF
jgi:hypothetical protein